MSKSNSKVVGVLHPGMMGISVANALVKAGHRVCWSSENRSAASVKRAAEIKLSDCGTLNELCTECSVLFSVCPPAEALTLVQATADNGFSGIYVDCNAVSPMTSKAVSDITQAAGINYVDGGIIGPPAWSEGTTRLYLSGSHAEDIAALFDGSLMGTVNLGDSPDAASAMKMAYAAWTKGSAAMLLSVYALAEHHGLGETLKQEWGLSQPGLENKLNSSATGNAPKAWRFVGEMQQIAATLADAGQHPGAFDSAADVYAAMSDFKSSNPQNITVDKVINSILDDSAKS